MDFTKKRSVSRLSDLPDGLICHILSFLPTKESVKTCVLGKRWKSLWTEVSRLDFDFANCATTDAVNRVMLLNRVDLNTFSLNYDTGNVSIVQFETWIEAVIQRRIKKLQVKCYNLCGRGLPSFLFSCNTLVGLSLCSLFIPLVKKVCLLNLRKLNLLCTRYTDVETFNGLVSGPSLEELNVVGILYRDFASCSICSRVLKRLTIVFYRGDESDIEFSFSIDTPSLVYLVLNISDPWVFRNQQFRSCLNNIVVPSLIEAVISFSVSMPISNWFPLVRSHSRIKSLTLSCPYAEVFDIKQGQGAVFTRFQNLKRLSLQAGFHTLIRFLASADSLKELVISVSVSVCEEDGLLELPVVPVCLVSSLETIELHVSHLIKTNLLLLKYLLKNCRVLKSLQICREPFQRHDMPRVDWLEKICSFQRGSAECKVLFRARDF